MNWWAVGTCRWALTLCCLATLGCDRCQDAVRFEENAHDCGEDLDCFTARARNCTPASVLHRSGTTVTRYEVVTEIGSRCHFRRTQLAPDIRWDGRLSEEERMAERWDPHDVSDPAKRYPHLMQCLYTPHEAAEVMERIKTGRSTAADLEPCYVGDGSCGPGPHYAIGCVPDRCLLGRWVFSCEDRHGRHFRRCEGTRLSEARPECFANCAGGKESVDCRPRSEQLAEWDR